jgi:hemoglobin/transferrin/lactoferrin receptor protein
MGLELAIRGRFGIRRIGKGAFLALLLATASVTVLGGSPALAQAGAQTSFDIAPGPLGRALAAFGRQSGTQVSYEASIAAGKTSPGIRGPATREQAIAQILQGSGLAYSFADATNVLITQPAAAGGDSLATDGSVMLDAIQVTGDSPANRPFETPGTSNYISAEELERLPPQTAGAIFQGTPGVISGATNNGASIDPNIRGLQGMNRVATTIDGSQQSTSSYRGYAGVDNRTYVDPDLISGITVTKGPDGAVGGAIGGTIAMETLGVADILREGENWGVRVRGGGATNTVDPVIGATEAIYGGEGDAAFTNGSFAVAAREDNVDFVGAFVRRQTGNYFAGTRGSLTTENYLGQQEDLSNYGHGQLVYNTSEDVTSALLKTTFRPTDEQELQIGYLYYGNEFGEVTPSAVAAETTEVTWQVPLSSVDVNQVTARYRYRPVDNDLVDFRANAYASNVDESNIFALLGTTGPVDQQSRNFGANAWNTSRLSLFDTPLALEYGLSYTYERAIPTESPPLVSSRTLWALPPDGERQVGTMRGKAKWDPLSWLSLEAGLEYITYRTSFFGIEDYLYAGPEFASYEGDGLNPSASVTVTPLEGWQLYAQYTSGTRPQSLREVSQTRFEQEFNPDLKAEQASNWEVGTNLLKNDLFLAGDKARLKFAYFENTTDNYIGREFVGGEAMMFFNYDYVRFKGLELSGGYDAGWGFVDFGFNYYTDFEACLQNGVCVDYTYQADYLTNQMPPRFTASVTAGARFLEDRLTLGGRVTYMDQRLAPLIPDEYFWTTAVWEPYTVVDLFGRWKLNDNVTLDVSVQNLLDAYCVDALNNTDMPAPGRTVTATLTGRLGGTERPTPLPFGPPPGSERWTGLYIGGHFGYGFGSIEGTTTTGDGSANDIAATESADQSPANMLAGGQVGYNYQFRNGLVLGVEADFSWTHMTDYKEAAATEAASLIDNHALQARTDYSFDWLATVRGKAGYAWDNLFLYGTAGVAFLQETETRTQYRSSSASASLPAWRTTDNFFVESADATRTGFTIGGGAEYALTDRWSIKLDYAYAGFGAESFLFSDARAGVTKSYTVTTICRPPTNSAPPCNGATGAIRTVYPGTSDTVNGRRASNEVDLQMVKIGVNYRF